MLLGLICLEWIKRGQWEVNWREQIQMTLSKSSSIIENRDIGQQLEREVMQECCFFI